MDVVEAEDIYAVVVGGAGFSVECVDAAGLAEIMLRDPGIPPIFRQGLRV